MAEINKNILVADPFYSTGAAPLDAKTTPVDSYAELASASGLTRIPAAERYVGLTVTALNNGHPVEYWLVGGTKNRHWKIKAGNILGTKAELLALSPSACTVGLEMIVQVDETNDDKVTKYWVTAIDGENVTWERKQYGGGANVIVDGEDIESEE